MPRSKRADEAGAIYHAINRGNLRADLCHKPADYDAFVRLLGEGLEKYPLEVFSFTLMPNHWHLVIRPANDGQMGRLLGWLSAPTPCAIAHITTGSILANFTKGHSKVFLFPAMNISTHCVVM